MMEIKVKKMQKKCSNHQKKFKKLEKFHEDMANRSATICTCCLQTWLKYALERDLKMFFSYPSDLMKSTVVDESLSSTQLQFCSRENQLATINSTE